MLTCISYGPLQLNQLSPSSKPVFLEISGSREISCRTMLQSSIPRHPETCVLDRGGGVRILPPVSTDPLPTISNVLIGILRPRCLVFTILCRLHEIAVFPTLSYLLISPDTNLLNKRQRSFSWDEILRTLLTFVGRLQRCWEEEVWRGALRSLRVARQRVAHRYDEGRSANPFRPGDRVLKLTRRVRPLIKLWSS